jgi:filamin
MYTPFEQGVHKVDVTYEGLNVPRSPFTVNVTPGCDPGRVRAYGPGLEGGHTNQPQIFTVETRGAGQGGLGLAIEGPSEAKMNCRDNRDGSCTVEYLPTKPGDYDVAIKFADRPIPGSPFHVHITDEVNPQRVTCYGPGIEPKGVRKGQPALFTVDATQAGIAPLEVITTDQKAHRRPAQINPRGDGTFDVVYYPDVEGPCKVDVLYAGKPVHDSPFKTQILPSFDASKVVVSGDGVRPRGVLASLPTSFVIDTRDAGLADLDVVIQDPQGNFVRPKILDNGDGTYVVTYTPSDVGTYTVGVKFGGQSVPSAPFRVTTSPTGDASKVKILDGVRTTIPVGEECVINISTAEAGYGNITCHIRSTSGSDVDIDIVDNGDGTVSILYTPRVPGAYTLNIKFGGQPIPSGQFTQQASDLITPVISHAVESIAPAEAVGLYNPVDFCIPIGPVFNFVSAVVTTPSGKRHYPKLEDNRNGTVKIRYQPTEVGMHTLDVAYNQSPVAGSPFKFYVDKLGVGHVTAFGPGLSHGITGEPCNFTIITKDAGAGGLALAVEGPSKAEIHCVDNKDGTCSVSYLPTAPGEYSVIIRFADQHIAGSPFTAKITSPYGDDQKKAHLSVGASSEVSLKVTEADISNLTASIRSPSGLEEPCVLKRLANGHLGISFTPREVGDYLVNVYRHGQHIPNSPFKIYVGETEIGNAGKVKVYGKGLSHGMANELNEFFVNTKDAGYGGLSLSIEGPSKADIECQDNEDGSCRVTYKPTEPGNYVVNVKFADEHVPGSPFLVAIGGEPSGRVTERIVRQKEAADITHIGSQCELSLKIPGTSRYDMEASVTSPSGITELCDIQDLGQCHYSIKFVPKEMGIHTVSVKHRGMHIPGSPFQFTVGPITDGGAHKVRAIGPGLERGEVNKPCNFNIYTREAGAGGLSIAVEGPSKAEIDFQDHKDGSCEVAYTCTEPGEYLVSVKFNDQHIPDSPFKVYLSPSSGDSKKLNIYDLQEHGLQINKPAAFTVDFNGAQGKLDAHVVAPSGAEDQAVIQEVDKDRYAVRFVPRENGVHFIHVRLNGNHIPGSPFRLFVGKQDADAGLVRAYGDGLSHGMTGQLCKFIVNTVNAGSGALAVTIDGPSKVQLSCREVDEGYEFTYSPTAPGDYLITIKYAGSAHIPGSPFKAHIEGPGRPTAWSEQSQVVVETVTKTSTTQKFAAVQQIHESDATKVSAMGAGLQYATANKEATFTVDTSRGGINMLMVGVMGPKLPCEEVRIRHVGRNQYSVSYLVQEPGNYVLVVKWGDQHIPGSPFHVAVQ